MFWFLLLPFVFADRLSQEENVVLQAMCGQRMSSAGKRFQRSMHTPEAKREEAPWAVLLKFIDKWNPELDQKTQFEKSNLLCSGTLISSRHVLTAAHCFGPLIEADLTLKNKTNPINQSVKEIIDLRMTFHRRNLNRILVVASDRCVSKDCNSHGEPLGVKVKKVFFSSEFVLGECLPKFFEKIAGDIAIVELEKNVPFSKTLQPACLAEKSPIVDKTNFTMYGYGMNHKYEHGVLRKHEATVKECAESEFMDANIICSNHPIALACSGDSGSGQIVFENETAFVSAVMVAGKPCWLVHRHREADLEVQAQDINVIVLRHIPWICEVTGICRRNPDNILESIDLKWIVASSMVSKLGKIEAPPKFLTLEKLVGDDLYA